MPSRAGSKYLKLRFIFSRKNPGLFSLVTIRATLFCVALFFSIRSNNAARAFCVVMASVL
jgi:hypothetical protein